MIYRIWSDLESFKTIHLRTGLNILLADKSKDASSQQSRNGTGKTSLVEIIHFLFGSMPKPRGIFRGGALGDTTFYADVKIAGHRGTISRSCKHPGKIRVTGSLGRTVESSESRTTINQGLLPDLAEPVPEALPSLEGQQVADTERGLLFAPENLIPIKEWKALLGNLCFGLPKATDHGLRFAPTFRSIFPFFARRQDDGGFQDPIQSSSVQQLWSQQVTVSFLLGLDATISQEFQELRETEKTSKALRKALADDREIGRRLGTTAELRTELAIAQSTADKLRVQIDGFRVVPQYRELEREADNITKCVSDLNLENVADRALLTELVSSLEAEEESDYGDVLRVYDEAGIVLPNLSVRRLQEVKDFHKAVTKNRRLHLQSEIKSANSRIKNRNDQKEKLDGRRQRIMEILGSGGALEHYSSLREELGRIVGEVEVLTSRLEVCERLDSAKTDHALERGRLERTLQNDIRDRQEIIRDAIIIFKELSTLLYDQTRAGSLTISASDNGPIVGAKIDSERSKGIKNMQIFCFDLMLAEIWSKRPMSLGFLIHDSHLFDGIDERQVARALQLGHQRSMNAGFQYIVTMNTDALPTDGFEDGFLPKKYAIDPILTDAKEDGGLFGFRFN